MSPNEGTWIITSYAVANAISVLTTSWLSTRFGQVRVFSTAVALFTIASLGCGISFTFPMLLFFRVMQGGVSGLMVPLSQALLMANYPPQKRGIGMAIWAMTVTVAPVIGPIVGGLITDTIGWSWIFFLNLPFGIGASMLTWHACSRMRETQKRAAPLDWVGFLLVVAWVGSLQIMLDKGNELDWFDSPFIKSLAAVALGCGMIFLVWEWTAREPLVELRLFKNRNFTTATVAMALGYTVFFASIIVLPLWLQTQMSYTATWAGLVLAPTGLLAILCAPIIGKSLGKVDLRWIATIAFVVFGMLSFWRAAYPSDADYWTLAAPQFVQGIAVATFFTPLISLALGALDGPKVAAGSGLMNFLRRTAASFGASVAITLWDHRNATNQTALASHLGADQVGYASYFNSLGTLGITGDHAKGAIAAQLMRETSVRSINDIFMITGVLFFGVIAFVWLVRKPKAANMAGAH